MTTLERVLLSREVMLRVDYPYMLMFPRLLDDDTIQDINDWLEDNCKDRFSVRNLRNQYSFRFASNDDFMLFSLRWL